MSQAVSPSVDRVYGLARAARCWNVSRATVYRHRQAPIVPKRRPGPVGPCDDATLLEHIKKAIAESRFTGEGYSKNLGPFALFRRPQGRVGVMGRTRGGGGGEEGKKRLRRRRSLQQRMRRQPLPSPGAGPPGCAPTFRRHRQGRGRLPHAPARPRTELHVRPLPERDRLPRHRGLALLRAPARGQRRRRALHPDAEGKLLVGHRYDPERHPGRGRGARFLLMVPVNLAEPKLDANRPFTGACQAVLGTG